MLYLHNVMYILVRDIVVKVLLNNIENYKNDWFIWDLKLFQNGAST